MRIFKLFPHLALAAVVLAAGLNVYAQQGPPAEDGPAPLRRPNLLAELGLSPEQVQQIRRINQERRPVFQAAQMRLREANRALDAAIYADTANDAEVQARLKDFQAAQAEIAKIRFESELAVRKVLTPEQLVRFRELRRKFEEFRQNMQRRNRRPAGPVTRPPDNGQPPPKIR